MKIASVLDYLKSDEKLTTLLNHKRTHPKITAYKAHDKNSYPYIIVKLEPFLTGVVTSQFNCEVRVVTDNELKVENLTQAVIDRLHFANRPTIRQGNNLIYDSSHAGGTLAFDEEKGIFEQVLIFNIKFNNRKRS